MADLFSWWQQDLVILPTGDLLVADGTIEGQQRVMRRLLTNPADYFWHLEYGAGLPRYVGQTKQASGISALIMAQMMIEDAVAQSPTPVVKSKKINNGLQVDIKYVDNNVGQLVTLGFNVNA